MNIKGFGQKSVDEVKDKFDKHEYVDICFDDEMVDLAIINIKIDK